MKRKWWVVASCLAVIGVLVWLAIDPERRQAVTSAVGLTPPPTPAAPKATKPICSQQVVPTGDCIPQYLAHLPPDPGEAGKATLEGIDSDKDGTRDDVQRFIAEKWGESQRAVRALTMIAQNVQRQVQVGATISEQDAYKLSETFGNATHCYVFSVDEKIRNERALALVETKVTNTPERLKPWLRFERLLTGTGGLMSDAPLTEICGYDPATLPN